LKQKIKRIFLFTVSFLLLTFFTSVPNGFTDYVPIISERVSMAVNQNQKVRVMIKLKEEHESPFVSRMTTAKDPARFISRKAVKRLRAKLESSFTAGELKSDINIVHRLENIPWVTGRINQRALSRLRNNPNVAMVSEDLQIKASLAESGPLIDRDTAHSYGYTGSGINIAVFDTGIDTNHPDLINDIVHEECFLNTGCPPGIHSAEDGDGHGTHVSGIITSSNSIYKGIAPDAGIAAIKILDDNGNGLISDALAAADWIIDNGAAYAIKIINMSFGVIDTFPADCDKVFPLEFEAAVTLLEAAKNAGVAVFAAAGNDAKFDAMTAPACISSVISVGAVYDADVGFKNWSGCSDSLTSADKIVCFSNVASSLDLLAPGSVIQSSDIGGFTSTKSGTSMASPHAAGVAALLLEKAPALSVDCIEDVLKRTGELIFDSRINMSFPRINAAAALNGLPPLDSYDVDENYAIGNFELLEAIDDWAIGNLGNFDLLDLIDLWAGGPYC
jgi:subtilisin family serine protease